MAVIYNSGSQSSSVWSGDLLPHSSIGISRSLRDTLRESIAVNMKVLERGVHVTALLMLPQL